MRGSAADFVDAIPLPTVLILRDERIEAANDAARALLGTGIEGRHFITALRQPDLLDAVEACQRDGAPRQTRYLTSDGRHDTTFHVTLRAVMLDSGRAVLLTFDDVTEQEQIGQMRRDFVANVSHELRTPLTAILGFIETLKGPAQNDPTGRERFLSMMEDEAHRMNRLVADLLSLSRVEAEERVRPTENVDPAALILSTVHGLTGLAEENGVTLITEVPEDGFHIPGDPHQLRQVLNNLIENAIKYGGAGTQVTIALSARSYDPRVRGQGVRIVVRDTGPGIDPLHIPRLTERFYRVDDHRSREMGGTGLGLAIVKHIVHRHRGRLRIDSALGEGTEISVILPSS